jgi:hypothetical protein
MSAIANLQQATLITARLVRDGMREAQGDPAKMEQLQTICETKQSAFQDIRQFDKLNDFVQGYYQDQFDFTANTSNPMAQPARVTEARITKVTDTERNIDVRPPAPPPRSWYRDPLNITGHAEAGAKVEFYNASQPNRPVIGDMEADADGKFRFELTDETLFKYGDQIGIRVIDGSGDASEAIVVPTEPFRLDRVTTNYRRGSTLLRTDRTATLTAMGANHDTRNPFFQQDRVNLSFTPPATHDAPHVMEFVGGDDSVEPNSTLTVKVGNDEYTTKADKFGKFGLKVFGFQPGDHIKLEIKDINGKGVDVDYQVPTVTMNMQNFSNGIKRPPSSRTPSGMDQVVGDGPPWVKVDAPGVTVPHGAVIIENQTTGEVMELKANENGDINAALGGVDNFDVLEMVARDAKGNLSEHAEVSVMLPEKVRRFGSFLVPAEAMNQAQPNIASVLEAIEGPPQDVEVNGEKLKGGPFLGMPDIAGIQYMRADKAGKLEGLLRGVNVGDQLNFQVLDAAGRTFPVELHGWQVPGAGQSNDVPAQDIRPEARTLNSALGEIGNGTLDLIDPWLTNFEIKTGAAKTPGTSVPLEYSREFFGDKANRDKNEAKFDFFPPAVLQKMGFTNTSNISETSLKMDENSGTKRLTMSHTGGRTFSVGVDYVMGRVNLGQPNSHIAIPQHLAHLTEALKSALGFVGLAYAQGKEPGNMEYDRAMGAAKTVLYVFDRLAVDNPAEKQAIIDAAKAAIPDGGFPFEILGNYQVPPEDHDPNTNERGKAGAGALSVMDARLSALGKLGVGSVGQADPGARMAPTVESATIIIPGSASRNAGNVYTSPLRIRGRATPGDIVQIYNMSSANKTLLAEAVVGPDGTYDIVNGARDLKHGDQLGVMSVTRDAKKSPMIVVPTDGYTYTGRPENAVPIKSDQRPPFFKAGATELKNVSYEDNGKVREGGPFWKLTGEELSVEPFSSIRLTSTTPDGAKHEIKAKVDGEGRFDLEFAGAPRTQFTVAVTDRNGNSSGTTMRTPGLADSLQTGNAAADEANGVMTFHLPDGVTVRGVVTASSAGQNSTRVDETLINDSERGDDFVDVRLSQKYSYVDDSGRESSRDYHFKLKIPAENAKDFSSRYGDSIRLSSSSMEILPVPGNPQYEMRMVGDATVMDRDFGMPNMSGGDPDGAPVTDP